ncbi:MAG: hypothetical protein ACJAUR_000538 [Ulvibacter sp.]|jgi:hypothetical protein
MKTTKTAPKHTIKEILINHLPDYLSDPNRKKFITDADLHVINTVKNCQTAKLGLYCFECSCCGGTHQLPRSCKNRFCSLCGSADTMDWVRNLTQRIPDMKYHHVVFTLPAGLRSLAKRNKKLFYTLLFNCSQEVIQSAFKDQHNLLPGIVSVLHTNGSDLKFHPHVHLIVSCGGFTKDNQLLELSGDYLFPQRVLGKRFKELFLSKLLKEINEGGVELPQRLQYKSELTKLLTTIKDDQWIVNVDKPIKGVEKIIAYVGRYTKKSCISERRILSIKDNRITLSFKDYKNSKRGEKPKEGIITLTITEFLDRLFEHLPIKGFKVVRYYGMFSSSYIGKIDEKYLVKNINIEEYDYDELDGLDISDCRFKRYRKQVFEKSGIDPLFCYHCHQTMDLVSLRMETSKGWRSYEYEDSR